METQLWFNQRGSSATQSYANNSNTNSNTNSTPGRANNDPVTQTVICNKCSGGFGIGNMFTGTVCPSGWTTDTDPCNTRGTTSGGGTRGDLPNTNGITCYDCLNGVVQGRSYQNLSVCPQGETTDPNPCDTSGGQVVSCNQCQSGVPVGNIFTGTVCPTGWTSDINPCFGIPVTNVYGCMDDNALNYNPLATYENGSCGYTDQLITEEDDVLITEEDDVLIPDIVVGEVDDSDKPVQFDNICYSCVDGAPKGEVIPSEVQDFCPEGYSQDMDGVCPKEDKKDNNDLILYLAIGIGAYMLLNK